MFADVMKNIGILISFALAVPALVLPSCERIDDGIPEEKQGPDSLWTCIHLKDNPAVRHADIFVYSDGKMKKLEGFAHLGSASDSASFLLPVGDKIAVCIANSGRQFNAEALGSYDSMEILRLYYSDEVKGTPMMRGTAVCCAGDTLGINPESPLCSLVLTSVEHSFPNYKRLEDPVVYLQKANAFVEALKFDSFIPSETVSDTSGMRGIMWDMLPCDIGMYPQHPGTSLQFYPNESALTPTVLVVEGKVTGGEKCRFSTNLPLMSCGNTLEVQLEIDASPSKYKFSLSKR